jgi:hypothetical protein
MLPLPLVLAFERPPLPLGPFLPPAAAFDPPRELTCSIQDLGRPRMPPLLQFPHPTALSAEALRPRGPDHLVGPVTDAFLFLGLAVWSSRTGGQVTSNAWPGQVPFSTPLVIPGLGLPPQPAAKPQ